MSVYYKKVQRNSSDAINFIEKRRKISITNNQKKNKYDKQVYKVRKFENPNDAEQASTTNEIENEHVDLDSVHIDLPLLSNTRKLQRSSSTIEKTNENIDPFSSTITLTRSSSRFFLNELQYKEEYISTRYGRIFVAHKNLDTIDNCTRHMKPIIITYHDIGLNYISNYVNYFNNEDNQLLLSSFAILHINAPGSETSERLSITYQYPSVDQLIEQILDVVNCFNIQSFIAFGTGLGAYLLSSFALRYSHLVDGLFLINPIHSVTSWSEWFYQKRNIRSLLSENSNEFLPKSVQDYLLWYYFGKDVLTERDEETKEIIELYRAYLESTNICPYNLGLLIESFIKRNSLNIERNGPNFKCQVVAITGCLSPLLDETIALIGRLNPTNFSWMKISGCGLVIEEKPEKVTQALRLFLQGLGYTLKSYERKRALMSGLSLPCLTNVGASEFTPVRRLTTHVLID